MTVQPVHDHGQTLPVPQGRAIGFVDTKPQCEAIVRALNAAGYPDAKITSCYGEEGLHLVKRLEGFFLAMPNWG